jgi:hypothetical protein
MTKKKNFKSVNPFDNFQSQSEKSEPEHNKKNELNMSNKQKSKHKNQESAKKYLRLNVTDYQDYIALMADYTTKKTGKYKSMTQYILDLIAADQQKNSDLYDKLQQIEEMKQELI